MEYRIQSTGELKTQGEVRKTHSNTSLPRVWDANVCAALGIDPVLEAPKPDTTDYTQAARNGATQDAKGNWVQAWKVVDMFQDTTDDDGVTTTKSEHEEAHLASLAEAARLDAIKATASEFEKEVAVLKEGYTEDEVKSWPQQVAEAIAYQADQTAETTMLDAIVVSSGVAKDELVLKIVSNASQYAKVFGAALGKKQKAIKDLGAK